MNRPVRNGNGPGGILLVVGVFVAGGWMIHEEVIVINLAPASVVQAAAPARMPTGPAGDCWLGQSCTPAFSQCDPQWGNKPYANGTMCNNGCGPAAMAMVITALTGKQVTPAETGKYAHDLKLFVGGASKHTIAPELAKKWGLRAEKIPGTVDAITKAVQGGGLVIMSGHGQLPFVPSKDPNAGHYFVVRGIENGHIKIGNSAFPATNSKRYNLASLIDNIHQSSVYAIYK